VVRGSEKGDAYEGVKGGKGSKHDKNGGETTFRPAYIVLILGGRLHLSQITYLRGCD
jgi:hypothetical protein